MRDRETLRIRNGFTLIELSIVLVIIGLIVGGVLTGRDLIKAAQVRSIITEFNAYNTAVATFRTKYNELPGDMTHATSYWGSAGGTGNDTDTSCTGVAISGPATCNGDGNGSIGNYQQTYSDYAESVRFWQHLNNANMLAVQISGIGTMNTFALGSSGANSKYSSTAVWAVFSAESLYADNQVNGVFFTGGYGSGNVFFFGASGTWVPYNLTIMPPADAMAVDQKMDDGMPATGAVRTGYNNTANNLCTTATSNTNYSATYSLTDKNPDCDLIFIGSF